VSIPVELILLTLPSIVYAMVQRERKRTWRGILERIGWQGCSPVFMAWALGFAVVLGGLGVLAVQAVPSTVLHGRNVSASYYAGWTRGPGTFLLAWAREALYAALGGEVFFRGLLGGWLVRRFGFQIGNALQAAAFLLPHLLLLVVSLTFWPLVVVQGLAGWLLGWLRYRSDSILPGWFAHSLVNALGALVSMR